MKVSILLPAYNAAQYLKETLDSIVNQIYRDFEVLLIDDGSTDGTQSIAKYFARIDNRVKYYKNEKNLGLIKTLNKGLSLASGEYIVRMDADDIMDADRLLKQIKYMESHPECFVCGGQMTYIGELRGNAPYLPCAYEDLYILSLTNCPLYHPTVIIRNRVFQEFGFRYNDNYKHAEDYKLWSDIVFSYPNSIANINDVVLYYRISKDQITSKFEKEQELVSKRIRRENVLHVLSLYDIKLPQSIDIEIIETVSSFIRKEKNNPSFILMLILSMLYMSMKDSSARIKHFILSGNCLLFVKDLLRIKLGLSILLSGVFPNRGKRFII